jgi:hypothetical protein
MAATRHEVEIIAIADPGFAPILEAGRARTIMVADDASAADSAATEADVTLFDMIRLERSSFDRIAARSGALASISPVFDHADRLDLFFTRGEPPPGLDGPRVFAGLDFAIINNNCRPISDEAFGAAAGRDPLPVMISFGGADADNHSRMMVEALREVRAPLLLWLMLGDGYRHSHDELVDTLRTIPHHEIILARTNRSMWSVASNCAVAILSSGMSTAEAVYAGLPVISVRRANDPSNTLRAAYEQACLDGGAFPDGSYRRAGRLIADLHADRPKLYALRAGQAGLIDGKGAERVLAAIEAHVEARRR